MSNIYQHEVYTKGSVSFEYEGEIIETDLDDPRVPKDIAKRMRQSSKRLKEAMGKEPSAVPNEWIDSAGLGYSPPKVYTATLEWTKCYLAQRSKK